MRGGRAPWASCSSFGHLAQIHAQLVTGAQQERFVFAASKVDGKAFVHLALDPVNSFAEVIDAVDGVAGDVESKAQQLSTEIPKIFEAKAVAAGQLGCCDGHKASMDSVHSGGKIAYIHLLGSEPVDATLPDPIALDVQVLRGVLD